MSMAESPTGHAPLGAHRLPAFSGAGLLRRATAAIMLMLTLAFVGGCGYSSKTIYPTEVSSVQVKMFGNRTFYRGTEFELTEALVKEIELRTPYKVVSDAAADTVLEGTIVSITQTQLSRRRNGGLPQEMEMQFLVDFTWRNLRTGQVMADRKGLAVVGRYVPPAGETLSAGQHEAIQKLASQIVWEMSGQW